MSQAKSSASGSVFKILLLVLALVAIGLAWHFSGASTPATQNPAELLARGRAAAFFHKDQMGAAREALAPAATSKSASLDTLCDAASIEFAAGDYGAADRFLKRAEKVDSASPRVSFLRGQLLRGSGDFEAALPYFEATARALPDDLPTLLCLADVQHGLDQSAEAEETLKRVIAVGPDNGTAWYYSAVYRLSRIMVEEGREEAERYFTILDDLKARGFEPPTDTDLSRGTLALARSPEPAGNLEREPKGELRFSTETETVLSELRGAEELMSVDLDGDGRLDLLARGERGVQVAFRDADGWTPVIISDRKNELVVTFDMDNDGDLDLLVADGPPESLPVQLPVLYRNSDRKFARARDIPLPQLDFGSDLIKRVRDAIAVDLDHEGDLDLVLVGNFGIAAWRNDGIGSEAGGQFSEMETEGLDLRTPASRITAEDFDADQDVDLLIDQRLYSSLRGGRFEELENLRGLEPLGESRLFADVSGDALPDVILLEGGSQLRVARSSSQGGWSLEKESIAVQTASKRLLSADLDLDGATDVFFGSETEVAQGILAVGTKHAKLIRLPAVGPHQPDAFCFLDYNGDQAPDLACSVAGGVVLIPSASAPNPGFQLSLQGVRDNRSAVGAIVELRRGAHYRRIFWDGAPQLVGMGDAKIDILRIIWPNGVLQEDLDLDLTARTSLEQTPEKFGHYEQAAGLVGSCPFLYTWNGETYEFISDVLGITPLGLPMAPGMLVPPDHDEYVLIRGDQLRARDGVFSLQVTEELREVTYLDRLQLHVIDHAEDIAIFPDERFCFPPFPAAHTHTVRDTVAAKRVTGSDGKDWTAAVRELDDVHPVPFETYEQQFMGLATPHFLEFEFDAADLKDARKLRLLMTGWLFWTNASINMASARHEGIAFIPPILQVPDGSGGWRNTGPPVGFPAGKTKTMILDVTDLLDREDPRLRIFSTLQLYWDRVVLATDDDSAPLTEHRLEPISARLWDRGFSRPLENEREDQAERFDWNQVESKPRWDQHPGLYTRLGDVLPLLTQVDDRFCILGTGDALEVQFDATGLPKLAPGMSRDYLLFLDGWAKDRDPNTIEATEVEPLPFHGMSGYPYAETEHYPRDEEHESYRAEWNTRPAKRWIRPLAPQAEALWLLDG